jgi:predicted acetyltransferase
VPDSLRFRFAKPDEIPDVGRLAAHSFPGAVRTPAWWQEQLRDPLYGGGAETLFVGHRGDRFVASLQLHPLRQWIGGEVMPVAGVGSVAISPTERRRGLAAELMTHALRAARDRGDVASALYPFRSTFYQKLGYGHAGVVQQFLIAPACLPDASERSDVDLLTSEAELREALRLYGRWARTQNGQLERGEKLWAHLTAPHDRALVGYRSPEGVLEGYALVIYRADLPAPERFLEVDELVWLTPRARRGLYAWLASLGDQWSRILLRALPSQRLADWISEPRLPHGSAPSWNLWAPAATLMMGTMFRILDVNAAWSLRTAHPGADFAATFDVTDAQLPENNARWTIAFDAGRITIERDKTADAILRMNISTMSRIFIGDLSATAACTAGLLTCDRSDLLPKLDSALALPEPWTFDRF